MLERYLLQYEQHFIKQASKIITWLYSKNYLTMTNVTRQNDRTEILLNNGMIKHIRCKFPYQ